jgi:hypothetical protein
VLETGLASSVRLMKDRARLLAKLHEQSQGNRRTERFLKAEITALDRDIGQIQRLIAPQLLRSSTPGGGGDPRRARSQQA